MKPRLVLAVVLVTSWLVIWGDAPPGLAQTALERLEQSIRNRGQTPAATADKTADSAAEESGYLGAVADDKNDRGRGVRILDVRPDGPAAKGGMKANDLVTAVAGVRVRQMSEMSDILELFPPGDTVSFDLVRDSKQQQVKVTLGHRPAAKEPPLAGPLLPAPKGAERPADDKARIEQLQRRVEQLERRVEELERALADSLKNKAAPPARP